MSQGGLDGLGLDQLALTLTCWLSEVSSTLNSEPSFLRRSEPLFDCSVFVWYCVVSGEPGPDVSVWYCVLSGEPGPDLSVWYCVVSSEPGSVCPVLLFYT